MRNGSSISELSVLCKHSKVEYLLGELLIICWGIVEVEAFIHLPFAFGLPFSLVKLCLRIESDIFFIWTWMGLLAAFCWWMRRDLGLTMFSCLLCICLLLEWFESHSSLLWPHPLHLWQGEGFHPYKTDWWWVPAEVLIFIICWRVLGSCSYTSTLA